MERPIKLQEMRLRGIPDLPSEDEIAALVAAVGVKPYALDFQDVVLIVANTGLRSEELCSLRWEDVDFPAQRIRLVSLRNMRAKQVAFGDRVFRLLKARLERQPPCDFVLGKSPRAVIERVARQCRSLSAALCGRIVTLRTLRLTYLKRSFEPGERVPVPVILSSRSERLNPRRFTEN